MKTWNNFLQTTTLRWIDHTDKTFFHNEPFTALHSFALDDALSLSVSEGLLPSVVRLWSHEKTAVLGIPDARLPYLKEGIAFLKKQGYEAIVRNSGGLVVPLDQGVLNLSFIIPNARSLSIHEGYEAMFRFIQFIFKDLTDHIEAYEIEGSYCPGDYDLSIRGKKFAGISQRRVREGVTIQIYLDLLGDSFKKGELIREFYRISLRNEETSFHYPTIKPEKLKSLSSLLDKKMTVENVKGRIWEAIHRLQQNISTEPLTKNEKKHYEDRLKQMLKRNEDIC